MGAPPPSGGRPRYAAVAVPLPIPGLLVYSIPDELVPAVAPGARVRVPVGRRRQVGVVVELPETAPAGVEARPLEAVLDDQPTLTPELLRLADFIGSYYLAPPGEVVRAMIPSGLAPVGERRVWLTDAGAIASARDPSEAAVTAALREGGRLSVAQLQARLGLAELPRVIAAMEEAGRVGVSQARREGRVAYAKGVELASGDRADQLARCGRSPAARRAIEYLAAVGRPAAAGEVCAAAECGPGVLRRLERLGLLRSFTQAERRPLDRHVLGGEGGAEVVLTLRPDQHRAAGALVAAVGERRFRPFLLAGITGSGKTEVYLRAIAAALDAGRSAILMVPEIALVPALARELRTRFPDAVAMLHSALTSGERQQEWERIRRGEARLVLGPRSAIFAPVADLAVIVVDEEQDPAYKQDSSPRYHGRDVALVRGRAARSTVILTSATPSLETRFNVHGGKLTELRLTRRAGSAGLPRGIVVDLRGVGAPRRAGEVSISPLLQAELAATLAAGDQTIVLRNRRGYAPLFLCRACGDAAECEECGLPRTLHRREDALICHYCGSTRPAQPRCPVCGEQAREPVGAGTERVEERLTELFPGTTVDILDRDVSRRAGGAAGVLERFRRGEVQVLVGTQIVSKGHHFPRVALTAVLLADTYLAFPDFRAVERSYNLLTQIAGRAGRGDLPGKVVIQTYHPDHYAIRAAVSGDDEAFAAEELRFRRTFHYPPYTRMAQVLLRDRDRERGAARITELAALLGAHPAAASVRVTGPAPAPLQRLRGSWRFQLLLRSASGGLLRRLLRDVAVPFAGGAGELAIDVDPQQLM